MDVRAFLTESATAAQFSVQNFPAELDKRCKSLADVSLSRHPAVKSSQKYLPSSSLSPSY